MCGGADNQQEKNIKQLQGQGTASMGSLSVEAQAMSGPSRPGGMRGAYCYSCDHDHHNDDDGMPPEHLRAFEAFLEEVVPVDMIMASQREEEARVRRGGKRRSHDDDMKEKLRLWARAVAKQTMGRR